MKTTIHIKGMTSKCCDKNQPYYRWLRKQRDCLIGAIEEDIKKLKKRTDKLTEILKELVELNEQIYEIEYSSENDEDD